MFATEYFFFRSTWGPWQDKRVRNALIKSIPLNTLRSGLFIQAKTLVFPIAGYPELEGISKTDVEGAKKLLAEASITDFSAIEPLIIRIPEGEYFSAKAQIISKAWTALGFTVRIETLPYQVYYQSLRTDDYTLAVTSWIGDFPDPLSFLELFRPGSSLNDSGWRNDDFEKRILESSGKKQVRDRYQTLSEAEKILLDDGVVLPVAHNPSINVIDTNGISGWYTNPLDIHPFKFIKFVPRRIMPGVALLSL
jgi:oligopeptide transport system substrate-binding protein